MNKASIDISDSRPIRQVTLNKPPHNRLDMQSWIELREAFDNLALDEELRAIILTGLENSFCTGTDWTSSDICNPANHRIVKEALWAVHECPVPVICAVSGKALDTGFELVAMCDIALASETAEFGLGERSSEAVVGGRLISELLPSAMTRWLLYSGQTLNANEAYQLGAILTVVPASELLQEAWQRAKVIANNERDILREVKESLNRTSVMSILSGFDAERKATIRISSKLRPKSDIIQ